MNATNSPWNDQTLVTSLKNLWERGCSATVISQELGLSRNAIIGKAYRLQLPRRKPTVVSPYPPRQSKVSEPSPKPLAIKSFSPEKLQFLAKAMSRPQNRKPALPTNSAIALVDLEDQHCRYPTGNSVFCGATRREKWLPNGTMTFDGSYCPYHANICYRSIERR